MKDGTSLLTKKQESNPLIAKHIPSQKHSERYGALFLFLFGSLFIFFIGFICLFLICSKSVTTEAGQKPDYSHITSNKVVDLFCDIKTDTDLIDISKAGETKVRITIFGFINVYSRLLIVERKNVETTSSDNKISDDTAKCLSSFINDNTPPSAQVFSYDLILGERVSDGDILKNVTDDSETEIAFFSLPNFEKAGNYAVNIRISDICGNKSEYVSHINIHDINKYVTVGLNCTNADLAEYIFNDERSRSELIFLEENVIYGKGPGVYEIVLVGSYNNITVTVEVVDDEAPCFKVSSRSFLVGSILSPVDFVDEGSDYGEITYSFKTPPYSFNEGTFSVTIIGTDSAGNSSAQETFVTFFYDIEPPLIRGQKNIELKTGEAYNPLQGVTAYDKIWGYVSVNADTSEVDINTAGTYTLTYSAVDKSGNKAVETITVTVREPLRVCLDVANIMQKPSLPNGCEAVALSIVLNYLGYSVEPIKLYEDHMPKSPYREGDPWTSYVGDAKSEDKGYGCYAPCVVATGNAYIGAVGGSHTVEDVSGMELSYYEDLITAGTPVIMWGTIGMNCNPRVCWSDTVNGKKVEWHSYSHCLVFIGYTDDTYIFCDPLEGIAEYPKQAVKTSFEINFKQACIIK